MEELEELLTDLQRTTSALKQKKQKQMNTNMASLQSNMINCDTGQSASSDDVGLQDVEQLLDEYSQQRRLRGQNGRPRVDSLLGELDVVVADADKQQQQNSVSAAARDLENLMASLSDFTVSSSSHQLQRDGFDADGDDDGDGDGDIDGDGDGDRRANDNQADNKQSDDSEQFLKHGIGNIPKGDCAFCRKPIVGQVVIALGKMWHPEHFVCAHCGQELGRQNFYERACNAYCENDYHRLFSPRCAYCNGPIKDKCITAMDRTWHPEHFFCAQCGKQFGEEGFHVNNGRPFCRQDYFAYFALRCQACQQPLMNNYITALNAHWHPHCFACHDCKQPFVGGSFFEHLGEPYCETHYHEKRGPRDRCCKQRSIGFEFLCYAFEKTIGTMSHSTPMDRDAAVKAIADHMLRGYCMLDDYCKTCGGVLLQDRNKKILCVCCPVMDTEENEAAKSEPAQVEAEAKPAEEKLQPVKSISLQYKYQPVSYGLEKVRSCLMREMVDVAEELNRSSSVGERRNLLQLIQQISKTLKSLAKRKRSKSSSDREAEGGKKRLKKSGTKGKNVKKPVQPNDDDKIESTFDDSEKLNKRTIEAKNKESDFVSDELVRMEEDASAEISMSVEETNKLREKLGLAPLKMEETKEEERTVIADDGTTVVEKVVSVDGKEFVHRPALNVTEKKAQDSFKEKLQVQKERRLLHDRLLNVKLLAESDSGEDEEESALAWVQKSRTLEQERQLAEMKQYSSKDLSGFTVLHAKDEFLEGRETVLVLQDKDVLDDSEDVLINPTLVEQQQWKRNVENRKKKPDYDPFEEEVDEFGMLKEKVLLKKYDDEIVGIKKESFKLGQDGAVDVSKEAALRELSKQLREGVQSLNSAPLEIAREYYTTEEMAKFKKPRKRVKKQRKTNTETFEDLFLKSERQIDEDYGSRGRGKGRTKENYELDNENSLKGEEIKLEAPTDKQEMNRLASLKNDLLKKPIGTGTELSLENVVIEDEAEEEFNAILNRARKAKLAENMQQSFKFGAEKVVSALKNNTMTESDADSQQMQPGTSGIIFDSVSEYCRGLGEIPTYGRSGNRDSRELVSLDLVKNKIVKTENVGEESNWVMKDLTQEEQSESGSSDGDDVLDVKPILEEEPEARRSVAAALQLAFRKGYLDKDKKGFDQDAQLQHLKAKRYTILDKQFNDIDDKYAKKLERMGGSGHGGPIVDFKEKKNYVPNVKLEYADEHGRLMDAKDAFRYLSWKFHGKAPGKKKVEKRMKKIMETELMNEMSSTDTPLGTLEKQIHKQRRLQTPYIYLSGGGCKDIGFEN
ncbi:Paxillin [Trichinella spiralis]|uniref:Paxillin n=1 Tax=Trichinella spiralis TaxID=6334 RepID=A0A0V1BGW0_TRISP|nr:Paxillin [Trichinella spiralis]